MATQYTTSLMSSIAKEIVRNDIRPTFQQNHEEFGMLKSVTDPSGINGRGYKIPVYLRPETSQVWGAEGFTHPEGSTDVDSHMLAYIARYAKGFEFSGDMLAFDKMSSQHMLKIKDRFRRLKKNIFVEFSKLFYGDGSGVLGVVTAADATTVTLANTVADADAYPWATFGTGLLEKGQIVDIYDNDETTFRGTFTVDALTSGTVFTAASGENPTGSGVVDGDIVVPENSLNAAYTGIHAHCVQTTGDYQALSRTTYPQLAPRVSDQNAQPLSWGLMYFMEEISVFRLDADDVNSINKEVVIMTSQCQISKARMIGVNQVRFQSENGDFMPGFKGVGSALGGSWKEFTWCPEHAVYYVHKPSLLLINAQELDFTNYGSNGDMVWATTTSGGGRRDAAYGSISWKGQLIGIDPRKQGAMIDLEMSGPRRADYVSR